MGYQAEHEGTVHLISAVKVFPTQNTSCIHQLLVISRWLRKWPEPDRKEPYQIIRSSPSNMMMQTIRPALPCHACFAVGPNAPLISTDRVPRSVPKEAPGHHRAKDGARSPLWEGLPVRRPPPPKGAPSRHYLMVNYLTVLTTVLSTIHPP